MKCLVNKDSLKQAIYTLPPSHSRLRDMKAASCTQEPNDLISQCCFSHSQHSVATFSLPDVPIGWTTKGLFELSMLCFLLEEAAKPKSGQRYGPKDSVFQASQSPGWE